MATCTSQRSLRIDEDENGVKVETLLSPRFELEPGSVSNKFYYGIDFPKGHIGVRGFDAEVVDEEGNSIPLHETYLHHWVVGKLMIPKGVEAEKDHYNETATLVYNSGVCAELPQYFGLGSETRKTDTRVPDPYGIELTVSLPNGGDLIYAVAHQHVGGVGSTLFGEDGRVLCNSFPIYGNGTEAGNEDGYIVGMSTCYPQPGSVKIAPMEKLTIISNYSSAQMHTGVMGRSGEGFNLGSNDVMYSSTSGTHAKQI
nr:uncharacterized protein LOC109163135 [Ipomoea batatas]